VGKAECWEQDEEIRVENQNTVILHHQFILQALFSRKIRKGRPLMRAVRALVLDTRKEIPEIGISIKPFHKNQGHFKQYYSISTEPI